MILKKIIRFSYNVIGLCQALIMNIIWDVRDIISPPKEMSILIVAHPDDDVLFFHEYIKKKRPYVVCMTCGGILRRIIPFYKVMHQYGVRYRAFNMKSRDVEKEELIKKRIAKILRRGNFTECVTHNEEGEYGHIMHQCIFRCVQEVWHGGKLYVPVNKKEILKYRVNKEEYLEKNALLRKAYKNEYPTLQNFDTWIKHEALKCHDLENNGSYIKSKVFKAR